MISKNVICPVCGASCDDIQVDIGEGLIVKNACKMGNAKFQEIVSSHRIRDSHRIREPMIMDGGSLRKAPWNEAIQKAAEILANAKRPLLSMGSETSCEGS